MSVVIITRVTLLVLFIDSGLTLSLTCTIPGQVLRSHWMSSKYPRQTALCNRPSPHTSLLVRSFVLSTLPVGFNRFCSSFKSPFVTISWTLLIFAWGFENQYLYNIHRYCSMYGGWGYSFETQYVLCKMIIISLPPCSMEEQLYYENWRAKTYSVKRNPCFTVFTPRKFGTPFFPARYTTEVGFNSSQSQS